MSILPDYVLDKVILVIIKFKNIFLDSLNPIYSFGLDIEIAFYYLHQCPNLSNEVSILLDIVSGINTDISSSCDPTVVKLLLHPDESLDLVTHKFILNASVDFISSV